MTTHSVIPITVKSCARCGQDHASLVFYPLVNAPPDITHWAMCPKTDQPILLAVRDEASRTEGGHST